ncbi:MAG: SAM-dependent DNA methyltransferase, partial [Armatimonadetes bacterium]|nr:SAM-dependent DNA methyltransferase [Armatimonadota bacterium]
MLIARYLKALAGKTELTERGFYPVLARHVIEGLLGYPESSYRIEPKRQMGVPDLELLTDDGSAWVVGEIKLDDGELLDERRRARLWEEQARTYVRPETVHVLLGSPRAFCLLDVSGQLEAGVGLADPELIDLRTGSRHDLSDDSFRLHLGAATFEEACSRRKYERFRRGESPCGYLPLAEGTLPHFEAAFQYASETLLQHARRAWDALEVEAAEARGKLAEIEADRGKLAGDDTRGHQALNSRRWHVRKKHAVALQIHDEDYPQFLYGQAYAGTQGADRLRDIFLTDTVYVVLSRLLFVRLCEDLGLVNKKVSNRGLAAWRELVTNLQGRYQDLLDVAFKDAGLIYSRLFEATVFDWYTDTDGGLSELLERILYRLNAFSFRDVDRDLLGKIYQRFLPAEKRKRLGEFYTDDEVVDYILWRIGFSDDPDVGSRIALDPACGSNTFGVRAAVQ